MTHDPARSASHGRDPDVLRSVHSPAPGEAAYRVPWVVDRSRDPWYALENTSNEELMGVHLVLTGSGRLLWRPPLRVPPGERVTFVVRADDPARDCVACVRWFRPDGGEYVWRVVF